VEVFKISQKRKRKKSELNEKDLLKMEIAKELGIWEQVKNEGWDSLSNAVCGRVGGIMSKRLKERAEMPDKNN
jgi:hypothetical protein